MCVGLVSRLNERQQMNSNYSFRHYLPAPPTPNIVVIAAALDKTVETPTAIAEVPADRRSSEIKL